MSSTSQNNKVVLVSTSMHGHLYEVYDKDDTEQKKILYTGEISDDPKHNYCECVGWSLLEKCYHQKIAKSIMEIKI